MLLVPAVTFSDFILAIHILAVVIGFGVTFAYPLLFATASRVDPSVLPWLYRTMQRMGRLLINPGLLVVVLAGIYLASHGHQWSKFYVAWGIVAAIAIGALESAFMMPREGRLADIAERDLAAAPAGAAAGGPAGRPAGGTVWSEEYRSTFQQLALGGTILDLIVIVTVFIMAAHVGA